MESKSRKWLLISVPYLWLLLFFLVPFLIVLKIALSDVAVSIPPYTPQLDLFAGFGGLSANFSAQLDFENFKWLIDDALYINSYAVQPQDRLHLHLSGPVASASPLPMAWPSAPERWRSLLLMLVILPFWTSFLIRVYAWIGILKTEGLLNQFLLWTRVIDESPGDHEYQSRGLYRHCLLLSPLHDPADLFDPRKDG